MILFNQIIKFLLVLESLQLFIVLTFKYFFVIIISFGYQILPGLAIKIIKKLFRPRTKNS